MHPGLIVLGLAAVGGLVALAAGGKKDSSEPSGDCAHLTITDEMLTAEQSAIAAVQQATSPDAKWLPAVAKIIRIFFPDCTLEASTKLTFYRGTEKWTGTWGDIESVVGDKTLMQAISDPAVMQKLRALFGVGGETAPMPQGSGSYVGDPKGFTSWPGQAILPTQRAIGDALADMGYETGDWKKLDYKVTSNPTFESIKKWQADAMRFKAHYGAAWMPNLTPDGLLGNAGMTALSQIVERNINWPKAIADIPASVKPTPSTGGSAKVRLYDMLRALPELTEDQRLYIMLTAYGETGGSFRPTAHNDTPSEVAASQAAWDNNPTLAAKLVNCGHGGEDAWAIGSGGYGGRLVPYFGNDMIRGSLTCDPKLVFEARHSLLSAIITAYYMQQTWQYKASAKTVKNLRAGFYGLAYIKNPPADRIAKYKKHAAAIGLPESFVDRPLTTFPPPSKAKTMMQRLVNMA